MSIEMIKVYVTVENKNNLITTIPFKGVKVQVEFNGGNVMKNLPAKFYCSDPFTQKALDESDQNGRLYILHQVIEEAGDSLRENRKAQAPVKEAVAEEPVFPPVMEGEGSENSGGEQRLEFDNLAEAITYIATTWGEQVENESQARKYIEEKTGIKPVIHKG